jgi:hypothetical protein
VTHDIYAAAHFEPPPVSIRETASRRQFAGEFAELLLPRGRMERGLHNLRHGRIRQSIRHGETPTQRKALRKCPLRKTWPSGPKEGAP